MDGKPPVTRQFMDFEPPPDSIAAFKIAVNRQELETVATVSHTTVKRKPYAKRV